MCVGEAFIKYWKKYVDPSPYDQHLSCRVQ